MDYRVYPKRDSLDCWWRGRHGIISFVSVQSSAIIDMIALGSMIAFGIESIDHDPVYDWNDVIYC